jgi:Cys-tRNA(Pro) deacylase
MPADLTPVGRDLDARGVPFREFRHPGPISSLEQAAAERSQRPEQVVRSLLFRLGQDEYVMVLVAGPRQVDWKALRRHFGQSRLTTATADEVRAVTGYEIGAVSPFGLPRPMRVLLDESVTREAEVSIGSGERGVTVILSTADLVQALGDVERADVVQR